MKILSLTTSYPHDLKRVSGIFVGKLLGAISKKIDVEVLAPSYRGNKNLLAIDNVKPVGCRYAPAKYETLAHESGGIPAAMKLRPKTTLLLLMSMSLSLFFNLLIRVPFQTKIIHANWSLTAVIAIPFLLVGKKLVVTLRGDDITRAKKSRIDHFLLGLLLKCAAAIVVVSKEMKVWLEDEYENVSNITYIGNGVSRSFFKLGLERDIHDKKSCLNFIYVGSLIGRKNIEFTIRALSALPATINWVFRIVGDGPERENLEALAKVLGIADRVIFCGVHEDAELLRLMKLSDIFIFSSRSEGRPNVIMEAMAAGLVVIAPKISGVNELIENNISGFIYDANNDVELKAILLEVAVNLDRYRHVAEQAIKYAVDNIGCWEQSADQYLKVFESVVHPKCVR